MLEPMNAPPAPGLLRYAVYPCSWKIGLSDKPSSPMAVFANREHAVELGTRMWPETFEIVDLEALLS